MAWVQSRWPVVVRLLSFTSAVGGSLSVPFTLSPFKNWGTIGYVMLGVSAAFLVVGIVLEIRAECSTTVFAKANQRGIRDYMYRWIQHGGPVAIWTRDHTWVADDEMRSLLADKARLGELTLCVPSETAFSRKLAAAGGRFLSTG